MVARNEGDRFNVVERFPLEAGRQAVWLDIENDTDADFFVVQGRSGSPPLDDPPLRHVDDAPDLLFLNDDRRFSMAERFLPGNGGGNGEAVAVSDFDRDGRLDLVITNGYLRDRGPVLVARNVTDSEHWGAVELIGSGANPDGYGATIYVEAKRPWVIPVTDGVVFHSQSETGHLVVPLGRAGEVRIEVHWPDGRADCGTLRNGTTLQIRARHSPC